MGRGAPRGPVDLKSKQAGYELADTNVRNLVVIMVVSIVIMAVGVAGVFAMFASFDRHFIAQSATDTKEQRAAIVPPLPHLQADPYREIDATLMEQTRQLTTYGWNGEARASAHIPIERAMRRVVGKPLDAPVGQDAAGQLGGTRLGRTSRYERGGAVRAWPGRGDPEKQAGGSCAGRGPPRCRRAELRSRHGQAG